MTKLLFSFENCEKFIYRVSECENLLDISLSFGVSPQKLIALNSLTSNPEPNSILLIERCKNAKLYQVMPSDTLRFIAEKFSTSEQKILSQNRIEYVYPFQIIEI